MQEAFAKIRTRLGIMSKTKTQLKTVKGLERRLSEECLLYTQEGQTPVPMKQAGLSQSVQRVSDCVGFIPKWDLFI